MKILQDIGEVLARILEPISGRVALTELRDQDGISPVYDIGSVAEAAMFSMDTRGWDTGAMSQNAQSIQLVEDLPPIHSVLGVYVVTEDSTRLTSVSVSGRNVGVAGSTREQLLWHWRTGDDIVAAPPGVNIGDAALAHLLQPPQTRVYYSWIRPFQAYRPVIKSRQGMDGYSVVVDTNAFGAGTNRTTGHIVIGFYRRGRFLVAARPF